MSNLSAGKQPLSDQELDRLEAFLAGVRNERAMSVEELDGFFCALIAGPELVMPSEYLNEVWGGELPDENAFESEAEATSLLGLMMRHWNAIVAEYETEVVYGPLFDAPDERGVPGRRWARGFMRGVALRPGGWGPLLANENEGQLITIPMVAGEIDPAWPKEQVTGEKADELRRWMAAGAARAYRHFATARRASTRGGRVRGDAESSQARGGVFREHRGGCDHEPRWRAERAVPATTGPAALSRHRAGAARSRARGGDQLVLPGVRRQRAHSRLARDTVGRVCA